MANETQMTVIGNLTADVELRYSQAGIPVASFTIASTPRVLNRQTNEWEDGESLFLRCSIWREAAENAAASLTKGTRVIAQGKLKQRSYQTKEGENRTVIELDVEEVGPSLKYATAEVTRAAKGSSPSSTRPATAADEPWATPGAPVRTQQGDAWAAPGAYGDDTTPF